MFFQLIKNIYDRIYDTLFPNHQTKDQYSNLGINVSICNLDHQKIVLKTFNDNIAFFTKGKDFAQNTVTLDDSENTFEMASKGKDVKTIQLQILKCGLLWYTPTILLIKLSNSPDPSLKKGFIQFDYDNAIGYKLILEEQSNESGGEGSSSSSSQYKIVFFSDDKKLCEGTNTAIEIS